jgi:hypothetical protein
MRELALIAAVTAAALAVVAASVGPGRDVLTFVSPPEVVAEEFVRSLATGRYDRAVRHLDDPDGAEVLTAQGTSLRARAGHVNQVDGEEGSINGDRATASTRITTSDAGDLEWRFSLVRRDRTWKIRDWSAVD